MSNATAENDVRFECPDGAVLLLPSPFYIASLPEPAWAKMGRLEEALKLLKTHGVPGPHSIFHIMSTRVMESLMPALKAELAMQMRRVTGKPDPLWDHDVVVCLTTQCNVSYTEATAMPMEERVRLLLALPDYHGKAETTPPAELSQSEFCRISGMTESTLSKKLKAGNFGLLTIEHARQIKANSDGRRRKSEKPESDEEVERKFR